MLLHTFVTTIRRRSRSARRPDRRPACRSTDHPAQSGLARTSTATLTTSSLPTWLPAP